MNNYSFTLGTSNLEPVIDETPTESIISQNSCNMDNQQETTIDSSSCQVGQGSREEQNIIESMDDDASVLRQRRVAFYNNWNNESQGICSLIYKKCREILVVFWFSLIAFTVV